MSRGTDELAAALSARRGPRASGPRRACQAAPPHSPAAAAAAAAAGPCCIFLASLPSSSSGQAAPRNHGQWPGMVGAAVRQHLESQMVSTSGFANLGSGSKLFLIFIHSFHLKTKNTPSLPRDEFLDRSGLHAKVQWHSEVKICPEGNFCYVGSLGNFGEIPRFSSSPFLSPPPDRCAHCALACLFCEFMSLCSLALDCGGCGGCLESCCGEAGGGNCPCGLGCGMLQDCCGSSDCLEICLECCSICFPA
uniref:MyoD family inhibitor domain containing n=1 Tax=Podarcis muralis TaxID=64176 RepID=A0A670JYM4_PODMU